MSALSGRKDLVIGFLFLKGAKSAPHSGIRISSTDRSSTRDVLHIILDDTPCGYVLARSGFPTDDDNTL